MARIRSVKPEFWSDPVIAQLSHSARLLYIGLWGYCDDEGRGQYLPKQIEGFVFPREDLMNVSGGIHELLSELVGAGRIVVYEADGDQFFHIPTWHDHQRPQHPRESKFPAPDQGKRISHETLMNGSGDSHENVMPVGGEVEVEGEVVVEGASPPKAPPLPEEKVARDWCDIRGITPTRTVLRHMIPKIREYISTSGDVPTRTQLEEFHRRGIKTPGGWGWGTARDEDISDDEWEAIAKGEA